MHFETKTRKHNLKPDVTLKRFVYFRKHNSFKVIKNRPNQLISLFCVINKKSKTISLNRKYKMIPDLQTKKTCKQTTQGKKKQSRSSGQNTNTKNNRLDDHDHDLMIQLNDRTENRSVFQMTNKMCVLMVLRTSDQRHHMKLETVRRKTKVDRTGLCQGKDKELSQYVGMVGRQKQKNNQPFADAEVDEEVIGVSFSAEVSFSFSIGLVQVFDFFVTLVSSKQKANWQLVTVSW